MLSEEILKSHKLKVTPGRVLILDMFTETSSPLSAENIYKKLSKKHIDLATIYRNIILFIKYDILKKVDLRKDSQFYELKSSKHHHHITCEKCGTSEDIQSCNVTHITEEVLRHSKSFDLITDHSLEFFSQCKKCQRKK